MSTRPASQTSLPRRRLGRTGLQVAPLALGAWGFLNSAAPAPARIDREDLLLQVLSTAFDAGMNLIDSAEVYANEDVLGRLLRQLDNVPEDLVVSTKFGHGKGFTGEQIRDSVERSLRAFGVSTIPLFMLHDPRTVEDMNTIAGDALPVLRRLQDEGVVGSVGIATGTLTPLRLAVESGEYDVIQFPRLYTLLNQAAKTTGLLQAARDKDVGTILTSPFTGNILGTGVRGVEQPYYSFFPAEPEVVAAVARMEETAMRLGISLTEAAIAYPAREPLIDLIVFGVTGVEELRQDIAAWSSPLTGGQLQALADAGTIDPHLIGGPEFVLPFPEERREAILGGR